MERLIQLMSKIFPKILCHEKVLERYSITNKKNYRLEETLTSSYSNFKKKSNFQHLASNKLVHPNEKETLNEALYLWARCTK